MLRFKLGENADPRWREPLTLAGYEVSTIAEESLQEGAEDEVVAGACQTEGRCLITVDLDFADERGEFFNSLLARTVLVSRV